MLGRTISHYRILERLGEGAMGVVYKAEDLTLGRPVAVKVIHERLAASAEARARFAGEARNVAALNHPNVCTIHEVLDVDAAMVDASTAHGTTSLIVLEWVDGETVQSLLSRVGRLPVPDLMGIAVQVADGLAEAHGRGIVHRDLKPGNVMVTPSARVKILDFGLAKAIGDHPKAATDQTRTSLDTRAEYGDALGTPAYMSPEQAQAKPVDSRTDVFSFGTMLYEMAAGCRPFAGETATATIAKILETEPRPLLGLRSDLPADLDRIVRRCLQKNAADRYHDTRDLLTDLKGLQHALLLGTTAARPAAPSRRRRRALVWLLGTAAVVGIAIWTALYALRTYVPRSSGGPIAPAHQQLTFVGDASYPSISPDGAFIAYVRGEPWGQNSGTLSPQHPQKVVVQDLAAGGQAIEIGECGNCGFLRWMPDGSGVLVSDSGRRVLLLARLGGERRRFDPAGYLSFSPSGNSFAGGELGAKRISITEPATGKRTFIPLKWPFIWLADLDWSASGSWLAVLTDGDSGTSIWSVSPYDDRQEKIADTPNVVSLRSAPRGDALYFLKHNGQTRELWKMPISFDTGSPPRGAAMLVLGGLQAGPNFDIDVNGRRLVYTREIRSSNLWIATIEKNRDGQWPQPVQLTSGTQEDTFPSVSPDGKQIAFVRATGEQSNVFLIPVEGGPVRQLTSLNGITGAAAWSPNGAILAFCAQDASVKKVWTMAVAGGAPRSFDDTRCTTSVSEVPLSWIAEHTILYHRSGNRNYYALDLQTGREQPLLQDESLGWLFAPRASPDSSRLAAFWNQPAGGRGLWLLPTAQSAPVLLRPRTWPLAWSANGRSIYGFDNTTLDILSIPSQGGTATVLRTLAGRIGLLPAMTPDAKRIVYSSHAIHADVWLFKDFDPAGAR